MALLCLFSWLEYLIDKAGEHRRARTLTWKHVLAGLAMLVVGPLLRSGPPNPGWQPARRAPRPVRARPARYRNLTTQQYIDTVLGECIAASRLARASASARS